MHFTDCNESVDGLSHLTLYQPISLRLGSLCRNLATSYQIGVDYPLNQEG